MQYLRKIMLFSVVSYNLPLEQSRFFEVSASFYCALFPRGNPFHEITLEAIIGKLPKKIY